jgi:hypothetical protein
MLKCNRTHRMHLTIANPNFREGDGNKYMNKMLLLH